MDEDDRYFKEEADRLPYRPLSEIDPSALSAALSGLCLLGDDPYLRMQAMNLGIVDPFIADLEEQLLRKLIDQERTPIPDSMFVSAQSQMWLFAAPNRFYSRSRCAGRKAVEAIGRRDRFFLPRHKEHLLKLVHLDSAQFNFRLRLRGQSLIFTTKKCARNIIRRRRNSKPSTQS